MRLSLKAKVLSLAVLPVLLFALVISLTTLLLLTQQAPTAVAQPRDPSLPDDKAALHTRRGHDHDQAAVRRGRPR